MTLGGAGVLVVVAGLTGALAGCGERRGDREGTRDDSLRVDSVRADSLGLLDSARAADSAGRGPDSVPTASRPPAAPVPAVPPESAVRRPPIMDPAAKDRPPARLPRPDSPGTAR